MLKMTKVYSVANKGKDDCPRFFLQHLICETAGFLPGEKLFIAIDKEKEEIYIQNTAISHEYSDQHNIHVSHRVNKQSGTKRPILDTAGDRYRTIVDVHQKVEVQVYSGKVVIRPLQYDLLEETTIPNPKDKRLRLLSLCAGAGIGTSILANTGYFTPVMEVEYDEDSSEVLKSNFPNSYLFNGDLRDCNSVMECDVALVTLPCNTTSSLSFGDEGVFSNLVIAASKIIKSSRAHSLIMENVSTWYNTQSYELLKELLIDDFPYWVEKKIESHDFGSLARRNRTYVAAFQNEALFQNFTFPDPPINKRRKKLFNYLEYLKEDKYEWKPLDKWMESFGTREAWINRSLDKTFVTTDAKEINCIAARYRSHCASNTYVLNKAKDMWRFLTESEIRRILSVPATFSFPDHTPITRRYEMLGQSVDGRVLGAIANQVAAAFVKAKKSMSFIDKKKEVIVKKTLPIFVKSDGQLTFM